MSITITRGAQAPMVLLIVLIAIAVYFTLLGRKGKKFEVLDWSTRILATRMVGHNIKRRTSY